MAATVGRKKAVQEIVEISEVVDNKANNESSDAGQLDKANASSKPDETSEIVDSSNESEADNVEQSQDAHKMVATEQHQDEEDNGDTDDPPINWDKMNFRTAKIIDANKNNGDVVFLIKVVFEGFDGPVECDFNIVSEKCREKLLKFLVDRIVLK